MNIRSTTTLITALTLSIGAFAHSGTMDGMQMKDKGSMNCMDMKGMDTRKCSEMMKGMEKKDAAKASKSSVHQADAIVKAVDTAQGKVTLAHEPVKSLGWPAMTMSFGVKDKASLERLAVGQKVHVEFSKEGSDYVVTSVK